jgi:RNase P subunit RPR2
VEPEIIEPPAPPKMPKTKRKDFEIGKCKRCGQLLLDDPENTRIKIDDELCEHCDDKLRAQYDKFKNLALIRALRAHKNIYR